MSQEQFPVTHTDAEWRALLTPEQYAIMREHGTERAGQLRAPCGEAPGRVPCAGCGQPLFESTTKFDSGTGWPSFTSPVAGAIGKTGRQLVRHDAHRGALRPLRLASRPRVSRRAAADGPALLHQRRGDQLHARRATLTGAVVGRPREPRCVGDRGRPAFHREARLQLGRPAIRRSRDAAASAC